MEENKSPQSKAWSDSWKANYSSAASLKKPDESFAQKDKKPEESEGLIHKFSGKSSLSMFNKYSITIFILLFFLGIISGYLLFNFKGSSLVSTQLLSTGSISKDSVEKGQTFGSGDEKTFKDEAEGVMKEGGIDGEGEYHLERPGGESQNVYLTSSVVDLSKFTGRKVKVWGQTNSAKKAGWLMDVGRLQVLE